MKLIDMFKIFSGRPNIFLKVLLLNVILLSGTLLAVDLYEYNQDVTAIDNQYQPLPSSFLSDGDQAYWIGQTYKDSVYYDEVYTNNVNETVSAGTYAEALSSYGIGNFDAEDTINYFELFSYRSINLKDVQNSTHYQFTLFPVSSTYIGIWVSETLQYQFHNSSSNHTYYVNNYYSSTESNDYIIIADRSSLQPQYITNVTITEEYDYSDIYYENNRFAMVFYPHNESSSFYNNVSRYVGMSTTLGQELHERVEASNYDLSPIFDGQPRDLRAGGSYFDGHNLPTFDIGLHFRQSSTGDTLQELPEIGLARDIDIKLIDDQGRVHLVGDSAVPFNDDTEGNYTGLNEPDYVLVDPTMHDTYYWDLFPSTNIHGGSYPTNIEFTQVDGNQFAIAFVGPPINHIYNDSRKWNYADNFNETFVFDWMRSTELQVVSFNPTEPTDSNFIQFNQSISQTAGATITYPRLPSALEIPETYNPDGGMKNPTDMIARQDGNRMMIYAILHDTGDGYTNNDGRQKWGNSLVSIAVDVSMQPELIDMKTEFGPTAKVDIEYDDRDTTDTTVDDFKGFHVYSLHHLLVRSSGQLYIFMHTFYSDSKWLYQGLGVSDNNKLHVVEVAN